MDNDDEFMVHIKTTFVPLPEIPEHFFNTPCECMDVSRYVH